VKQPLLVVLGLLMGSMFSAQARGQEGSPSPEAAPAVVEATEAAPTAVVEATEAAAPAVPAGPEALPPPTDPAFSQKLADRLTAMDTASAGASMLGNNAWLLTSCALVLFMTVPGLAMFYGGLVRKKNVLSVLMQCIFLMAMMTVLWAVIGYSLAFGAGGLYFGNLDHLFMAGVQMEGGNAPMLPAPISLPVLSFMLFQGMFFIITPALICGAFAERMKFSAMVVFSAIWGLVIYCPLCHWVWGGGFLANGVEGALFGGALDFAGGTVVHISSGFSALVCALMIRPRGGVGREDMRPHNLTYTVLGAGMLWFGWFGFNAGSELASDAVASSAFATTHFSAAAGAIAWAAIEWLTRGKASVLGAASGAVAGLVCITPASGFVQPMAALIMGALAGVVCYFACAVVKPKLKYDDSLDAFGVHGVGGVLGALLTGVFATKHVLSAKPNGLWYDPTEGMNLMMAQLAAVGITIVLSVVGTFIILKVIDIVIGLRVTHEDELRGLDVSQHGEEGYILH
jgi:ammonium transporter, Amt family